MGEISVVVILALINFYLSKSWALVMINYREMENWQWVVYLYSLLLLAIAPVILFQIFFFDLAEHNSFRKLSNYIYWLFSILLWAGSMSMHYVVFHGFKMDVWPFVAIGVTSVMGYVPTYIVHWKKGVAHG